MIQIIKKMSRDVPDDTMNVDYADYLCPWRYLKEIWGNLGKEIWVIVLDLAVVG